MAEVIAETRSDSSSRRHNGGDDAIATDLPYMHRVGTPPKQLLFQEIKHSLMETFFLDKPFGKFKHQSRSRKFLLALQAVFPILEWGRNYNLNKFRGDFFVGVTIASLYIPHDLVYAKPAYLDPWYGLCEYDDDKFLFLRNLGIVAVVYAAINAVAIVFIIVVVPETKGKSLEELQAAINA